MRICKTILALGLFWAGPMFAQEKPQNLPRVMSNVEKIIGLDEITEKFISTVRDDSAIFDLLREKTSAAKIIHMQAPHEFIRWDHKTHTIFANFAPCERDANTLHDLTIHELGHSVFYTNLKAYFKETFVEGVAMSDLKFDLYLQNNKEQLLNNRVDVVTISQPFDELFSDTLTVLILDNPQGISNALKNCPSEQNIRDFSIQYPLEEALIGPQEKRHVHVVLDPAKFSIWSAYANLRQEDKKALI